jgi:phosphoribosylanthranilate isomerase
MKLKICGMKYNSAEVATLRPDYLGFIFWEPSARYFDGSIPRGLEGPRRVGVFVDASPAEVVIQVFEHNLNAVQLHGAESPEYCRDLRKLIAADPPFKVDLIKAFAIHEDFDFKALEAYETYCEYFLFDTRGELPGGTGRQFNWKLLSNYSLAKPYFLSGGIGPKDAKAVRSFLSQPEAVNCHAIDINSKFETEAGRKDVSALKKFMNEIGHMPEND